MNIKKFVALVLSGVLCLTALTGCGSNNDDVIATLGDKEVKYGVVNFLCKYQKAMYDDLYISYYGSADIWQQDMYGYGTTLEDDLKEYVMSYVHDLYTLEAHMDEYGVTLTAEEEAAIDEAVQAFIAANSEDAIEEMSATEDILKEVLTLMNIEVKMYDAIVADADTEVSDEEASARGYSYIYTSLEGYYDDSYSYVEYTEEQIAQITENMEAVGEALADSDLETVAQENGYTVYEGTYIAAGDDTLDETLFAALTGLNEGETSSMVVTDTAIYFVRIDTDYDEEATEANRESIILERQNELYTTVMDGWQANDGWTVNEDVLAKVDFTNILTQTKEETTESE